MPDPCPKAPKDSPLPLAQVCWTCNVDDPKTCRALKNHSSLKSIDEALKNTRRRSRENMEDAQKHVGIPSSPYLLKPPLDPHREASS